MTGSNTGRVSPAQRASAAILVSFVLASIALAVSVYLTIEHYNTGVSLACPDTGAINCAKVTSSRWSHIGPVPFALLGLVFFVVMVVLCSPRAWRYPVLEVPRVVGAIVGVLTVLYLVYVELFKVDALCLWCTVIHLCSVGLLAAVLWQTSAARDAPAAP